MPSTLKLKKATYGNESTPWVIPTSYDSWPLVVNKIVPTTPINYPLTTPLTNS